MKPEDLFDPAHLPEDLQWVPAHHRLHPDDPVYLLIAWHWRRVKASEDTLGALIVELKTALDARVELLAEAAENVSGVTAALSQVRDELEQHPTAVAHLLDSQLRQPVAAAVTELSIAGKALAPAAHLFESARHRQTLAALLVGLTLGLLSGLIVLLA